MQNVDTRRIDLGSEISLSEEGLTTAGAQEAEDKPELMTEHSFGPKTAIHAESSSPPSYPSYGKKIPDTDEEILDLEVANVDRKVFADDDLELVVGLVKPLVAQLKAASHTTGADDDQTEVLLQNSLEGATELQATVIPSNDLEETTTSAGLVISDYYGEEEVTPKSLTGSPSDSDEPVAVVNQLPENIEVMNLVTDVSETEVKEPVNLPIYMAMTDKDTALDTRDDEEVFLLPAGHGLQFSFKVRDLGLLGEGGSLNVV